MPQKKRTAKKDSEKFSPITEEQGISPYESLRARKAVETKAMSKPKPAGELSSKGSLLDSSYSHASSLKPDVVEEPQK